MNPTTRKKRRIYFIIFSCLFVVLIPVVVFLADGYRLDEHFHLVSTGGVFLHKVPSQAEIYIDYKLEKSAKASGSTLFVQNLIPKEYLIVAAKSGYWSWAKHLTVSAKQVNEASIFMVPQNPILRPITETLASSDVSGVFNFFTSSSTTGTANPEYANVVDIFTNSLNQDSLQSSSTPAQNNPQLSHSSQAPQSANSSQAPLVKDNVSVWYKGSSIYAGWLGDSSSLPLFFCVKNICQTTIQVRLLRLPLIKMLFYPGRNDVLLYQNTKGIFALEIDQRDPQNVQPLYLGQNLDFVVANDQTIYIKKGADYFELQL